MGAFSELDMERNYSDSHEEAPAGFSFGDDSPEDELPFPQQVVAPVEPSAETEAPAEAAAENTATVAGAGDTAKGGETKAADAKTDTAESEDAKRKAHEEAEAKRKAEFDARQAQKKAAEQEQIAKVAAMSDDEVTAASMQRVSADTEKLTRRNMKECVAEFIQTKCIEDPAFARLTMHPRKTMIRCFQHISRKAWEYAQDELKANGITPGPGQQGYGCDVPDELCYQWAEEYFRNPNAKEDHEDDEEFKPKPYYGGPSKSKSTPKAKDKDKGKSKKKADPKPVEKPKAEQKAKDDEGQMSLLGVA